MATQVNPRDYRSTGEYLLSRRGREIAFRLCKGRCPVCQKRMTPPWADRIVKSSLTIDHLQAWSLGGSNELGNLVAMCGSCNSSKRNKPLLPWLIVRLTRLGVTSSRTMAGRRRFALKVQAKLYALAKALKEAMNA